MPIVQSVIVAINEQVDGRAYVTEEHTHTNGYTYTVEYLAAQNVDRIAVMQARAQRIGADIDAREAIEAAAMNYEIPLSRLDILTRISDDEFAAMESTQHPTMRRGWAMFQSAQLIYRGDIRTQQMFALAEALGIIAQGRAAEILA